MVWLTHLHCRCDEQKNTYASTTSGKVMLAWVHQLQSERCIHMLTLGVTAAPWITRPRSSPESQSCCPDWWCCSHCYLDLLRSCCLSPWSRTLTGCKRWWTASNSRWGVKKRDPLIHSCIRWHSRLYTAAVTTQICWVKYLARGHLDTDHILNSLSPPEPCHPLDGIIKTWF